MRVYRYGCLGAVLLAGLVFTCTAQMPSLKVEGAGDNPVYLQKLDVEVVIEGAIARTTWTMTFKNVTKRILEGELNFPLPQDVAVSEYALDINGVLREAVPVEKAKATMVFENTERRRIDPGILEKVDGNTFVTRIYPINPGGVRIVRIGYQQELSWVGQADLRYRLPLAFSYPLETFSIHISVPGGARQPRFDEGSDDGLHFDEWKQVWWASGKWTNYRADRPVSIRIPQAPGAGAILMQQDGSRYYYSASVFPVQERIGKPAPHRVALLWDVSLSGLRRDRKKEFELLDAYFARLGNVEADLIPFSNTAGKAAHFAVHNGDWQLLKQALEGLVYDGGTQFGSLNLSDYPGDEFLLFSDGHSTFGSDRIGLDNRPLYAVAATADADFPFLRWLAARTGGELINLNEVSVEGANELLNYQYLQFLGVKADENLEESYPSMPVTVHGGLTVTGICDVPAKEAILQFGYGHKVVKEEKILLDYPRQQAAGTDVDRIWAGKKLAELDMRYEDNKEEIRRLGRRYGLVTRNTSLVVLENVMDYVTYDIEPPADLRDAYDRILKGREQQGVRDQAPARTFRAAAADTARVTASGQMYDRLAAPPAAQYLPAPPHAQFKAAQPAANDLQEVVVTGYGVARKRDVTTSVTTVNGIRAEDRSTESDKRGGEPEPGGGSFTILKAEADTRYLSELRAARPEERYALYLKLRKDYLNTPLFYFHTAELFLGAGEKATGVRILSNIAEIDAENYELYKLMGYKLKETGETEAACTTFRKVLEWRPFEPQSYRDYGLALEDAGHYQQALDTLYLALTKNYDAGTVALYPGIEETLLPEINELIARHGGQLNLSGIPKDLLAEMPVDIRVVLNWNLNNTDIDLWVTDPDQERCFYGHRFTAMGGRISHDFTRGLGPEQFLLKKAAKGRYKVEVNYYGDTQVRIAGETTVLVEVYTHYGTPQQKRSLITLQLKGRSQGAAYVGEFEF